MSHRRWNIPPDLQPSASAIARDYQCGSTYLDLADAYQCTVNNVAAILRQQGVTPRHRGGTSAKHRQHTLHKRTGRPTEGERHLCHTMARLCPFCPIEGHCGACEARTRIDAGIHGLSTGRVEVIGAGR